MLPSSALLKTKNSIPLKVLMKTKCTKRWKSCWIQRRDRRLLLPCTTHSPSAFPPLVRVITPGIGKADVSSPPPPVRPLLTVSLVWYRNAHSLASSPQRHDGIENPTVGILPTSTALDSAERRSVKNLQAQGYDIHFRRICPCRRRNRHERQRPVSRNSGYHGYGLLNRKPHDEDLLCIYHWRKL